MSEALCNQVTIVPVQASDLLDKVHEMKGSGHRLGQVCCTKVEGGFELLYSFDKEHVLTNLKLCIAEGESVASITGIYWPAFIYENEMHDLFGVKFRNLALDYEGHFFKVAQPTPWNPKE